MTLDLLQSAILFGAGCLFGGVAVGLYCIRKMEQRIRKEYELEPHAFVFLQGVPFHDGHPPADYTLTHQEHRRVQ